MNATLPSPIADKIEAELATAAARRRFDASIELLMAFEPSAEQLTEAARALVKIAHKGMRAE